MSTGKKALPSADSKLGGGDDMSTSTYVVVPGLKGVEKVKVEAFGWYTCPPSVHPTVPEQCVVTTSCFHR